MKQLPDTFTYRNCFCKFNESIQIDLGTYGLCIIYFIKNIFSIMVFLWFENVELNLLTTGFCKMCYLSCYQNIFWETLLLRCRTKYYFYLIIILLFPILLFETNLNPFKAPASMKAVVQAAWLLTIAFGNLIVIIVAETKSKSLDQVFFLIIIKIDSNLVSLSPSCSLLNGLSYL